MKGKKTGGRKKGTPNKGRPGVRAIFDEHGFNPIEALIYWAKGDYEALGMKLQVVVTKSGASFEINPITMDQRLSATIQVADWYEPRLKTVELELGDKTQTTVADMMRLALASRGDDHS